MKELIRQRRVIDMMITMHSIIAKRNKNWALFFDLILLLFAVLLNALVFVDYNVLGVKDVEIAEKIIGVTSIVIFFISIVVLRVEWKKIAEKHKIAVDQLTELKIQYNLLIEDTKTATRKKINKFSKKYTDTLEAIVKVPNSKFNRLKKKHYYKIELSKLISINPAVPLFILKLCLFFKGIKEYKYETNEEDHKSG